MLGTTGGATIDNVSLNGRSVTLSGSVSGSGSGTAVGATPDVKSLTLQGNSFADNLLSGAITEANGQINLVKTGIGLWTVGGASSFTGTTTVTQGTLGFSSISNVGGAASALGNPTTVTNGTIALGNAANFAGLRYTGSGASSTNRVLNFAGTTGTIALESTSTGTITYNSAFTASGAGVKTLILRGAGNGAIAAGFGNLSTTAANATALTKNGLGTWTLSADNSLTGVVTVNQGTLLLNGAGRTNEAASYTINGGTLQIDNATNTNTRLGTGAISMGGGTLKISGSSSGGAGGSRRQSHRCGRSEHD